LRYIAEIKLSSTASKHAIFILIRERAPEQSIEWFRYYERAFVGIWPCRFAVTVQLFVSRNEAMAMSTFLLKQIVHSSSLVLGEFASSGGS
jgi:hypothetical protein